MAEADLEEVIYNSEAQLHSPFQLLRTMVRDLSKSRELAWRLFVRDFAAQYRQTALGYLWAVWTPLVTSAVFILLNSSNVLVMEATGIPYPVYVVMGTVFFGLFIDGMNAPLRTVNASRAMLVKVNFPREALVLSAIGQVMLSFAIKLILLVAVLAIFGVPVQATFPLAAVPLVGLLAIGIMVGVALVPIGLLFNDVLFALVVASNALVFLTPVAYLPPKEGALATIVALNPLTPLLMAARDFVVGGKAAHVEGMLLVLMATMVLLLLGWVLFRLALPILVERMGT